MLIAQGFDPIFKGIGDAADAFSAAFGILFAIAALAAAVVMIIARLAGASSVISLLVHGVVTAKRLARQQYRAKGPGLLSPLLTLPGLVTPAMALVVMVNHGVGSKDGIPLLVFLLSMAVLLFVWFAPWAQHVRAISQDQNVGIAVALGQVIRGNKGRFLLTIGVPLLLVIWVSAAINWQKVFPDTPIEDRLMGSLERDDSDQIIAIETALRLNQRLSSDWGQIVAAEATTVRTITLSGPGVTSAVGSDLQTLPELEQLALASADLDDRAMPALAKIKTLKRLKIEGRITDRGLQALRQMPQLTDLDISHTLGTDKGMPYLAGLVQLQSLAVPAGVTGEGLAPLHKLQLKSLVLPAAAQTDIGLEHYLAACAPRAEIDLTSWEGLQGPGLLHLPTWTPLNQASLQVDDTAMPAIGQLTGLQQLSISESPVSDAAVEHLARLHDLKTLDVSGTNMTRQGLVRLRSALPRCEITASGLRSRIDRTTYRARYPALEFDGKSYLSVGSFKYDGSHPLTVEAWVWPALEVNSGTILGNTRSAGFMISLTSERYLHCKFHARRKSVTFGSDGPLPVRSWSHVAFVYDGSTVALYVRGVQQSQSSVPGGHHASRKLFMIGADPNYSNRPTGCFSGAIREVRLSRTPRYDQSFTPAERFQADADTIALYHMDAMEGDQVENAAGPDHTASIHGATWLAPQSGDGPSPQVEGGGDAPASADANATSQTVDHPLAKLGAHIKTNDQDDVIGVTFFNHRTTNAELVHLKSLINLRALNLGRSRVTDAGLVHLKGLANLQELGLSLTITDAGLTHLQGLANLQALNLGRSRVSDAGLLHLKGLTKLQALNASGARQITDKGIFHLKQLTGLRQLKLNGTQLTDAGLVQLSGLTNLQELGLSNTQVTDAGLVCLKGLEKLERLVLGGTQITDVGLAHLRGLVHLRELSLKRTQVTDAGIAELQQALPNCKIEK